MHRALILLITTFLMGWVHAQLPSFNQNQEGTISEVIPQATAVEPGDYFLVALKLKHEPHFHSYFSNPGGPGFAPQITWELPEGFKAGETQHPIPSAIKTKAAGEPLTIYGYDGEVTFLFEIEAPENLTAGQTYTIKGEAEWQVCDENTCIPEDTEFSFSISVAEETIFNPAHETLFEKANNALPEDGSSWIAEAKEKDGTINFTVTVPDGITPKKPIYFFSTDMQVNAQKDQTVVIDGQKIKLTLARNADSKEVHDTLTGVLTYGSSDGPGGVTVKGVLLSDAVAGGGKAASAFVPATEEDRAKGLEVYDIDARPETVLIGGAKEKKVTFWSSLGLIFLGGLILNLMPCVFPVLGLKIMGFVSQAGEDESKIKIHGFVFGLGLLVTMWILAAIIISLKLDWGQQLANPVFLGTMIIVFFLMGLNLFGLFEFGTSMTSVGGDLQGKKGYSGSFFSGALTTLVATPCSGPFLGAVMAFALVQPPVIAFIIFTVFGLGIASPYIILSLFPALIKKLPRPGAWMESFKQIMSFFVFATVVFFMKGYLKLVGDDHFNVFLFALCLIGLGVYVYGRWGTPYVAKTKRMITGYGLAGLMTVGGITWAYSTAKPPKPGLAWHEWYPGIMEVSRPKGRIIWLDYTADW